MHVKKRRSAMIRPRSGGVSRSCLFVEGVVRAGGRASCRFLVVGRRTPGLVPCLVQAREPRPRFVSRDDEKYDKFVTGSRVNSIEERCSVRGSKRFRPERDLPSKGGTFDVGARICFDRPAPCLVFDLGSKGPGSTRSEGTPSAAYPQERFLTRPSSFIFSIFFHAARCVNLRTFVDRVPNPTRSLPPAGIAKTRGCCQYLCFLGKPGRHGETQSCPPVFG